MQYRVFRTADVKVNGHPVFFFVLRDERAGIFRIDVPEVIPAATGPLRHRVCFAFAGTAALWTFAIHPVGRFRQRRFGVAGGRVIFHLWQPERQFIFRYRHRAALRTMHNRNRFAPVTLPGEKPITQLIVHRRFAEFFFFEPTGDFLFRFRCR